MSELNKPKKGSRRHARRAAVQALYQWNFNRASARDLIQEFAAENPNVKKADGEYFMHLVNGVVTHVNEIDIKIKENIDRDMTKLNAVELSVLRLATFELIHCLDVPYRVVINEALELAKEFGSVQGFKFVNGVLDKLGKPLRPYE